MSFDGRKVVVEQADEALELVFGQVPVVVFKFKHVSVGDMQNLRSFAETEFGSGAFFMEQAAGFGGVEESNGFVREVHNFAVTVLQFVRA